MRTTFRIFTALTLLTLTLFAEARQKPTEIAEPTSQIQKPWDHGKLQVSDNQRFLQHADGTPFFWLGETAWLMPQRLKRD